MLVGEGIYYFVLTITNTSLHKQKNYSKTLHGQYRLKIKIISNRDTTSQACVHHLLLLSLIPKSAISELRKLKLYSYLCKDFFLVLLVIPFQKLFNPYTFVTSCVMTLSSSTPSLSKHRYLKTIVALKLIFNVSAFKANAILIIFLRKLKTLLLCNVSCFRFSI